MKKLMIFIACSAFFVSLTFSYEAPEYYGYSYARLSYVKGDVFIQRTEDLGYEEGTVNLVLVEGEKLGTRDGRAEVHFGRKNYLRVDSFTQVDFINLPRRENDLIKLNLLSGSAYLRVNFLEREKDFEIHTPDASFYILDKGLYNFIVRDNKETEFHVLEGTAEAAGEKGSLLVNAEETLIAQNGYFSSDEDRFYENSGESFAEWNRSRDELCNRSVGRSYLPSELYEYESELAYNGRWVYERPYGHVWIPNVHYASWRPYYNGRWTWYPIIGWTWVPYEPWGWSVYHYGRWHWRLGLGWYWIPTRSWGPAWVHWHRGYNYFGWCPLSYYGYPVVIVNNHFYSRYYGGHYPVNSRALTVVHKNQLQARQITKVALTKSQVTRLGKISLSSLQPDSSLAKNKVRMHDSAAVEVFSRSKIRNVGKTYSSAKSSGLPSRASPSRVKTSLIKRPITSNMSNSRVYSEKNRYSQPVKAHLSGGVKSDSSQKYSSRSKIKNYPSQRTSFSRSISSVPVKQKSSPFSKNSGTGLASRSANAYSSRTSINNYKSRIYPSNPELNRRTLKKNSGLSSQKTSRTGVKSSSIKSYSSRSSNFSSRYRTGTSQNKTRLYSKSSGVSTSSSVIRSRYSSSVGSSFNSSVKKRFYTAPSKNYSRSRTSSSSVGKKVSSSRSYSVPKQTSSSFKSKVSRSSSRVSSSSSSSKKIRIK